MSTNEKKRGNWLAYLKITLTVGLTIFDWATDIYTLHLYCKPDKPLMLRAFYASLATILLHNLISSAHGLLAISQLHSKYKLTIWGGAGWKSVSVALHTVGLGGLVVPLEALTSFQHHDVSARLVA